MKKRGTMEEKEGNVSMHDRRGEKKNAGYSMERQEVSIMD